jgi:hypothetical protein
MAWYAHPTAVVEEGASIRDGARIWHFAHVRSSAIIGAEVNLGKNVYIDGDVVLGQGARVLFTGANGWHIEGIQWLRRTVKGEEPPRDIVRAQAAGDMPLTVEFSRRGSRFSWKLGP